MYRESQYFPSLSIVETTIHPNVAHQQCTEFEGGVRRWAVKEPNRTRVITSRAPPPPQDENLSPDA